MIVRWFNVIISAGALTVFLLVVLATYSNASDAFVQMIERREGIFPGQTRVLPECSCTVRYVGTTTKGRRYSVIFDKLD